MRLRQIRQSHVGGVRLGSPEEPPTISRIRRGVHVPPAAVRAKRDAPPTGVGEPQSGPRTRSGRWASPVEVPRPPAVCFSTMTTNRVPPDEVDALLKKSQEAREELEATEWRTVKNQPVEDLSGVRGGWTVGPGPVVRIEGGKHKRRYWPARCAQCSEWHLRTAGSIRSRPDSEGCRTCLLRKRFPVLCAFLCAFGLFGP